MILVGMGLLFDTLYAVAGSAIGRFLRRNAIARAIQRWVFGTMLIGFGAKLALSPRPA
jgi:threonine/homoserine/homoserine lactone efflux protein